MCEIGVTLRILAQQGAELVGAIESRVQTYPPISANDPRGEDAFTLQAVDYPLYAYQWHAREARKFARVGVVEECHEREDSGPRGAPEEFPRGHGRHSNKKVVI